MDLPKFEPQTPVDAYDSGFGSLQTSDDAMMGMIDTLSRYTASDLSENFTDDTAHRISDFLFDHRAAISENQDRKIMEAVRLCESFAQAGRDGDSAAAIQAETVMKRKLGPLLMNVLKATHKIKNSGGGTDSVPGHATDHQMIVQARDYSSTNYNVEQEVAGSVEQQDVQSLYAEMQEAKSAGRDYFAVEAEFYKAQARVIAKKIYLWKQVNYGDVFRSTLTRLAKEKAALESKANDVLAAQYGSTGGTTAPVHSGSSSRTVLPGAPWRKPTAPTSQMKTAENASDWLIRYAPQWAKKTTDEHILSAVNSNLTKYMNDLNPFVPHRTLNKLLDTWQKVPERGSEASAAALGAIAFTIRQNINDAKKREKGGSASYAPTPAALRAPKPTSVSAPSRSPERGGARSERGPSGDDEKAPEAPEKEKAPETVPPEKEKASEKRPQGPQGPIYETVPDFWAHEITDAEVQDADNTYWITPKRLTTTKAQDQYERVWGYRARDIADLYANAFAAVDPKRTVNFILGILGVEKRDKNGKLIGPPGIKLDAPLPQWFINRLPDKGKEYGKHLVRDILGAKATATGIGKRSTDIRSLSETGAFKLIRKGKPTGGRSGDLERRIASLSPDGILMRWWNVFRKSDKGKKEYGKVVPLQLIQYKTSPSAMPFEGTLVGGWRTVPADIPAAQRDQMLKRLPQNPSRAKLRQFAQFMGNTWEGNFDKGFWGQSTADAFAQIGSGTRSRSSYQKPSTWVKVLKEVFDTKLEDIEGVKNKTTTSLTPDEKRRVFRKLQEKVYPIVSAFGNDATFSRDLQVYIGSGMTPSPSPDSGFQRYRSRRSRSRDPSDLRPVTEDREDDDASSGDVIVAAKSKTPKLEASISKDERARDAHFFSKAPGTVPMPSAPEYVYKQGFALGQGKEDTLLRQYYLKLRQKHMDRVNDEQWSGSAIPIGNICQ
mgnify:CR=1 FL=1